ncbi:hypothetical protein SSP24_20760 [Streptomyces spinoverrucosus]|uniref:Uncharacterized protein n=1 Tax=Streptomyces spinoverrucosus TaxID=284043 RepID=A0A4Y3VFL5_9ACTN|nr:hypothetical protein [Streptomyces spinoverrucosus]GEC04421.1 hypothetical protein SSP24_20760 [Streptomyces spinoverrucosus]GHB56911.1 hypothetical protein GCM10010397_29000 [Streptomyces spinoverrucosus]
MQWGSHRGRRIILSDGLDETDVDECAALMNAEKVRETVASVEIGLSREVTWRVVNDYYLHYGKEHPFGIGFVFASGPEESQVAELTEMLSDYFEPPSDEEILAAVDSSHVVNSGDLVDAKRRALVRLGVGAPSDAEPRFLEKIAEAMHSEDERVREGGLWAAAHALWPQLLPDIESMSQGEVNPVLRDQASALAGYMRQEGITP